ncbi:UNVERIFIED_CONTAM: hypothetical protein PYX00_006229 [Menopon gallinae]|uniref:Intraflagellar transport protein 80 homolog n=1 Tax=Menopon gallinae TaxID=328185 RepID=A0AAW2HVQ1_9NEOP
MHWFPKVQSSGRKQSYELLLITSADGKFHLIHKNGRLEKSVEAHKGAALVGQWSYDGAGLLTAGEDGQVKIWSRSGMLRSTILQGDVPIYTAAWSSDSNQVLIAQGRTLVIKPLAANSKPTRWRAHDGLILKTAWNKSNNLIISGGEDCKYKVWDTFGRQLYCSSPVDYPITSLSWAPGGELFAVGSYNTLKLCDKIGWSHSLDKPSSGSIYALAWSLDGTQVAGACSNGNIIMAHIIERRLEWKNFEIILTSRKTITVKDVLNDTIEKLDFPERVARMELEYNHLVVTTMSKCHVFSTSNWNTPIIFDLKEGSVSLILLTSRHFLLVERSSINIYSYDGRLLNSPKIPGMNFDMLDSSQISLSPETLAVLCQTDDKVINLFDISSGRQATNLSPVHHTLGITKICLSQAQTAQERQLAFVDRNRDVYICYVQGTDYRKVSKLGVMVQSLSWNTEVNILAGAQDSMLTVWLFPTALYIDKSILRRTTLFKDLSESGRSLSLVSYGGNQISLRRVDGAMINSSLPPYYTILHEFVSFKKWEGALRLCRFVNDETLWACLACMACYSKELFTAEEAYAAINELDKVSYLQYIKSLSLPAAQNAHLALLAGNFKEAENILLLNGLIFRAILVHMELHNWNRYGKLSPLKCYLDTFEKAETNEKFLQFKNEVEINPENIESKIELELEKEKQKKL